MNWVEKLVNNTISLIFRNISQPVPALEILKNAKIVAHRGVHQDSLATENSRLAFQLALKNKLWGVECDVRFTRDNVPVVIHDAHCGRLFQRRDIEISKISFKDLRRELPQICSLREVVQEFGKKLHLMIEIKENVASHAQHLVQLQNELKSLTPKSDYHLLSLHPEYLEGINFVPKDALLDVIWLNPKRVFELNSQFGHGAIAGHFLFFADNTIKELKNQGKFVGVGFLDSKNSLYRELNRGADFIFTDNPLCLMRHLN